MRRLRLALSRCFFDKRCAIPPSIAPNLHAVPQGSRADSHHMLFSAHLPKASSTRLRKERRFMEADSSIPVSLILRLYAQKQSQFLGASELFD